MSFRNAKIIGSGVSPASYHEEKFQRGDARLPISPSVLKAIFHTCPSAWIRGARLPESKSQRFGNLVDMLVLTPEGFDAKYIEQPAKYEHAVLKCPKCGSVTEAATCRKCGVDRVATMVEEDWSSKSTTCQEWAENQAAHGRTVLYPDELTEGWKAAKRVTGDPVLQKFVAASQKQTLIEAEYHDRLTGIIVPVRCLVDLMPDPESDFGDSLGDLKTARSARHDRFKRDVFEFGYHIQAAFDLDLYNAAAPARKDCWSFVVVENFPPYEVGRRFLRDIEPGVQPEAGNLLNLGRSQYKRMLEDYCWCLKNDTWPGYDDSDPSAAWTGIDADPWMERQVLFSRRLVPEAALPQDPEENDNESASGEPNGPEDPDLTP